MKANTEKLAELIKIMSDLRGANGCPWDRKQTPQSLKSYLLEETHEVLEAIDSNGPDDVRDELGDLLFIIVFLCQIYEEEKKFNIGDAIDRISEKMIRRHPHVFGDSKAASEKELRKRWLEMKEEEKAVKNNGKPEVQYLFDSVPRNIPALLRAQKISERAANTGFDWENNEQVFNKLDEEIDELKKALTTGDGKAVMEEFGDLLLVIVNIGRIININAENSLKESTDKFIERFNRMEKDIIGSGKLIANLDKDSLLDYWSSAKNN